jgi:hypothetical protein
MTSIDVKGLNTREYNTKCEMHFQEKCCDDWLICVNTKESVLEFAIDLRKPKNWKKT